MMMKYLKDTIVKGHLRGWLARSASIWRFDRPKALPSGAAGPCVAPAVGVDGRPAREIFGCLGLCLPPTCTKFYLLLAR